MQTTEMISRFIALINLYLRDCAENHKKLKVEWVEPNY
jgi:hypothetical protein